MPPSLAKQNLRQIIRARRAALPAAARDLAARAMTARFLDSVPLPAAGSVIAAYIPQQDEIDVLPLAAALGDRGFLLALPVVAEDRTGEMSFRRWDLSASLTPNRFGIPEPRAGADVVPDLLIVPVLAFDRRGNRLGQGGGYYDRALARLRALRPDILAVGAGFAVQAVDDVPADSYDEPLDMAVTDAALHDFRSVSR